MKTDVELFNETVLHYLKTKDNYIYLANKDQAIASLNMSPVNKIYTYAKSSLEQLLPTPFYKVEDVKKDIKQEHPKNAKSFQSYNTKHINHLHATIVKHLFAMHFTPSNTLENAAILAQVLFLVFEEIDSKSNKEDDFKFYIKETMQKSQISLTDLDDLIQGIFSEENITTREVLYQDALNMQSKYKDLKEIGLFYPVQFSHNLIKEKYHLFEINIFSKYQTKEKAILNIKETIKIDQGIFTDGIKLQDYCEKIKTEFNENVAYFNPFILKNKPFFKPFLALLDKLKKKETLKYDFLEFLNYLQFITIKIQQENLEAHLMTNKGSVSTYIKTLLNDIPLYGNLTDIKTQRQLKILKDFQKIIKTNNITTYTNITVEHLGYENSTLEEEKKEAEKILNKIKYALQKNSSYSLHSLHSKFSNDLISILKDNQINISMKDKYFLRDLISYIILGDFEKNKINKQTFYNSTYEKLYECYKKSNLQNRNMINLAKLK